MPDSWLQLSLPVGSLIPARLPPALTSQEIGLCQKLLLRLPQTLQVSGFHLAALLVFGIKRVRAGEIHNVEHLPWRYGRSGGAGLGRAGGCSEVPGLTRGMLGLGVGDRLGDAPGCLGQSEGCSGWVSGAIRGGGWGGWCCCAPREGGEVPGGGGAGRGRQQRQPVRTPGSPSPPPPL